jgi:hypothetical protein
MSKLYRYILEEDWEYPYIIDSKIEFKGLSDKGELLVNIYNGNVTIKKGYAWDGCSVKIAKIGSLYIGTPDGIKGETKRASCIHDVLYQFHNYIPSLQQITVDRIFRNELIKAGWKLWKIYFLAVRIFGGFFWNKK